MRLNTDGNITIIIQDKVSLTQLIQNIDSDYNTYKQNHVIVNLNNLSKISLEDIIDFLKISNTHRSNKKSFVIVSNKADLDTIPDEICVVPTLQEAYDIIEMEDIERDLGF